MGREKYSDNKNAITQIIDAKYSAFEIAATNKKQIAIKIMNQTKQNKKVFIMRLASNDFEPEDAYRNQESAKDGH